MCFPWELSSVLPILLSCSLSSVDGSITEGENFRGHVVSYHPVGIPEPRGNNVVIWLPAQTIHQNFESGYSGITPGLHWGVCFYLGLGAHLIRMVPPLWVPLQVA